MSLVFAGVFVSALVLWQTAYWTRQIALDQISERGHNTLSLVIQTLRGDLEKFRYMPKMLTENKDFHAALNGTLSETDLQSVNEELERINNISGAMDIYLMDATGLTIAASNWVSEKTFIGKNFNYRPYFTEAMEGRLGRYFALGTKSGTRGYYFAYPVWGNSTVIGVVVVKVQMEHHEDRWQGRDQEIIVVDQDGVLFLSSKPEWRFKTLAPLTTERVAQLRDSRRYGKQTLSALSVVPAGDMVRNEELISIANDTTSKSKNGEQFLVLEDTMVDTTWRIILLARTGRIDAAANVAMAVATVLLISILLALTALYQRRRRLAERIIVQEEANAQLENRVRERTNALTEMNVEMQGEITERKRAEEEVRKTQATLVQAGKLAALGQMSAGLSHELNQPLAAIRSYADNAQTYIARDQTKTASENLKGISELIDRMARIIRNLRTYARDETIELRPTSLGAVLDESLVLMGQRSALEEINVIKSLPDENVVVMAGDVRLQQVFVNLISNAFDAMKYSSTKNLHIDVTQDNNNALITFRDSGPGIECSQNHDVFDPFYSTKEVGQGMGLGLSITFGLVNQFGGDISVRNAPEGGALFDLRLKRAEPIQEAAQ